MDWIPQRTDAQQKNIDSFNSFYGNGIGGMANAVAQITQSIGKYMLSSKQARVAEADAKTAKANAGIRRNKAMAEGDAARTQLAKAELQTKNQLYGQLVSNAKNSKAKENIERLGNNVVRDNKSVVRSYIDLNNLEKGDTVNIAKIKSQVESLETNDFGNIPTSKKSSAKELVKSYRSMETNLANLEKAKANFKTISQPNDGRHLGVGNSFESYA